MNYVDILILAILLLCAVYGYYRGFIRVFSEFLLFVISLFLAFILNGKLSSLIQSVANIPPNVLRVLTFFILWAFFEAILNILYSFIYSKVPDDVKKSPLNKFFGILPGLLRGIFTVAVLLVLFIALPFSEGIKKDVLSSFFGRPLISSISGVERKLESFFNDTINETFTFLTIKPETDQSVDLNFKTSKMNVDEESEQKMLDLVNKERKKRGLSELVMDEKLREVARAHSKDMFEKGYFAHDNLQGESPFDRMAKAGIQYIVAGENLALAQDVELAHQGLMDSPGHKANILKPDFGKVGIGVQNGGVYGRMFTQNFTD